MVLTHFKQSLAMSRLARQRGASLLEAVAFLGIAAIVILGAVSLLRTAFGGAAINKTQQEVVTMRTNINRLYSSQSSFGTVDIAAAVDAAGMAPGTLNWSSPSWVNGFNGKTTAGGAATSFWISYTRVPKDACVTLVTNATGWLRLTVAEETSEPASAVAGSTAVPAAGSNVSPFSTPVSIANATSACKAFNTIVWYN